ncbi:MAG: hypothetical protein ACI86H_002066 [bacterium]
MIQIKNAQRIKGGTMDILELTKKIKESAKTRTHAERVELLREANIIDKDGYYSERFFSEETVRKNRQLGKPITL